MGLLYYKCVEYLFSGRNFTIVTALYDIGRSDWVHWSRGFDIYLQYFEHVLKLDVPMAIFVDTDLKNLIEEKRKDKEKKTKVYFRNFTELELYKHKSCTVRAHSGRCKVSRKQ